MEETWQIVVVFCAFVVLVLVLRRRQLAAAAAHHQRLVACVAAPPVNEDEREKRAARHAYLERIGVDRGSAWRRADRYDDGTYMRGLGGGEVNVHGLD